MTFWKIIALACAATIFVDAKQLTHQKRDIPSSICDPEYNSTIQVQCYCSKERGSQSIKNAECYLTAAAVSREDNVWKAFNTLKANKITFTNTRNIPLTYVPTNAITEANSVKKIEITMGSIDSIEPYAFGNVSSIQEINLRDNKIASLSPHAFTNHRHLKVISLDLNSLTEINRDVFVELPTLEKLFLTSNEISTIHDRAFTHLEHLQELEINRNKVFSLNFATFDGLKNLERLDLSNNALEVIGHNTFEALGSLKSLNLDENNIQMLDDKAFDGLGTLVSLSLSRNKLINIESEKVFEGLVSLVSLSLKGNQLKELKATAIAPILVNFYTENSNFDVEDNKFPCVCSLDWFISLKNNTLNKRLQNSIDNLKCIPDAALKEKWTKISENAESEKNNQVAGQEEPISPDYEYYDETQLNDNVMFYLDIRDILNCDNNTKTTNADTSLITKELASPVTMKTSTIKATNQGILDLSLFDTTTAAETTASEIKAATNKRENSDGKDFTTTRLATVSAKPESKLYEDMASDEAKPEKIKAHRSVQEEVKDSNTNGAYKHIGCVTLLVFMIILML